MKKYISLILSIIFVFSLCACGKKTPSESQDNTSQTESSTQNVTTEPVVQTSAVPTETNPIESGTFTDYQSFAPFVEDSDLLNHPNVMNMMLFGTDQYGGGGLSDSMILLSIDSVHKKIKLTSFMRDTYVSIPHVVSHKLNYAYAVGGAELATDTIESNYGIKIDRYAQVNYSTFRSIIDIIGGVEIELTANEISYINAQLFENNQTAHYLDANAGILKLSGTQALWHARNRGGTYGGITFAGDDWDRTSRQRAIISALIGQLRNATYGEICEIVDKCLPYIDTNLSQYEIETVFKSHAMDFLSYTVAETTMPANNNWYYGYNEAGSVILVNDWNQARNDLADFVFEGLIF